MTFSCPVVSLLYCICHVLFSSLLFFVSGQPNNHADDLGFLSFFPISKSRVIKVGLVQSSLGNPRLVALLFYLMLLTTDNYSTKLYDRKTL